MGKINIETDMSMIRTLMVDQRFSLVGFIRGKRYGNGDWQFDFQGSEPGTVGRSSLESVVEEVRAPLRVTHG